MAIIAGIADFNVARRNDFPIRLTIKDGNGDAVNLTGYTVDAEVWSLNASGFRDTKFADWEITYTNRGSGIVDIKLTDTHTAAFTKPELFYDVQLTEPDGDKFQYLKGTLYITAGASS
jgi:hypothetical protein|tara:strand:+ start:178 stop:531 length:354 start_codon:yes stop_codon:yes gene_type:complete